MVKNSPPNHTTWSHWETGQAEELRLEVLQSSKKIQKYVNEILNYGSAILRYKNQRSRDTIIDKEVAKWGYTPREILYRVSQVLMTFIEDWKRSEEIFRALTEVNLTLDTEVENVFDAVLMLDAAFQKYFPEMKIHILIANDDNNSKAGSKNPVANMLADMIEMQGGEEGDLENTTSQSDKLNKLSRLISVVKWTINNEQSLPRNINLIDETEYRNLLKNDSQHSVIGPREAKMLDPDIFGSNIWSALFHKLRGIGTIVFIGKNENQFQEDMSTSILEAKLREITMTLGHIASREENARDTLTKLPTRRYLLQNLDTYFKEALESQSHLSVVVIDLDKFKHVNDTYGHSVGDSVLKTFANVLASNLSNNDIKVRYGGEEFVVVSLASPQNTYIAMQRISQLFQSFTFGIDANWVQKICRNGWVTLSPELTKYNSSFSAWIDSISPEDILALNGNYSDAFQKMFDKADARVYISKNHGRKHIVSADSEAAIEALPVSTT